MSVSLFSKVFSYRQRDNHSPLENFITEIFAFCLKDDELFRWEFFKMIPEINYEKQKFEISTQEDYIGYGRPDIEINFPNTSILFECKIDAVERTNQLSDYSSILIDKKGKDLKKHIIFLTKYFVHKELTSDEVSLHLIRWFEVFKIVNNTHKQITQQFKQFLKEQNMEAVKNFTIQDLLAMKAIPATISKMDELLEQFKPEFEKKFGDFSKNSSRSSRLKDSLYINYVTLNYEKMEYWLLIGFFWWWGEEVELPYVGISIEIPSKKFESSDLMTVLYKELGQKKNWEHEEYDSTTHFSAIKPITDFISQDDDNIPAMRKFISENLQVIYSIREKYPKLLKK